MAGTGSWNPFALKCAPSAVATPASTRLSSFGSTFTLQSKSPVLRSRLKHKIPPSPFRTHAVVDDDEWGKEAGATVEDPPAEVPAALSEVDKLKQKLKDLLYGTNRGLKASSETRAEIVELITQLEAQNPTPAPTDALALLNGKWILALDSLKPI